MKFIPLVAFMFFISISATAQHMPQKDTSWKKEYRATATRINDLVHTKLDVKFDFNQSYLIGKAWVTLKPHFYNTDSLLLDAKGMDLHKVAVVKGASIKDLKYSYDGWQINIKLDKEYKGGEAYTIFVDYTSKPNEVKVKGSAAINDAKGLYFINPKGEDKTKPTQIWTQGETEANSVWFPTIDKPNQKTTEEILMTVPAKYITLSNGKLVSQKKNADGTRTDYWKMDLPHAPYLFFMGVGDFAKVTDKWKGKEVSYYVDKEYAPVARKIFGLTPEMISYFSKITGVEYPWVKYSQMTAHDYVSGAMENTTATLHSDAAQQDARELVDGNAWESTIAHELFHQWFGDYVTTESWSNITVNESFANYSETLWNEYKYGKDAGDEQNYTDMQGYLFSNSNKKDLVRFYYSDKEDVFDAVSYNKGGRILHMLRNYVGDAAFFKALNLYLTTNKFKSAEAQQLRLAFEEVTGRDLNWFWNQWYYGSGQPALDIKYGYDAATKNASVIVTQTQAGDKIFKLPVAIDVYEGGQKTRHQVWVENKSDTFYFKSEEKPDLINFDGDKVLLCTKKENKTLDEYINQYKYAGNYLDRREAIDFAAKNQTDEKAIGLLNAALKDKYFKLRQYVIQKIDLKKKDVAALVEPSLADIAKKDEKTVVRADAIAKLSTYKNENYIPLFKAAVSDSSYSVSGNALSALFELDSAGAVSEAKKLSALPAKGSLSDAITDIMIASGDESYAEVIFSEFEKLGLTQKKFGLMQSIGSFVGKSKNLQLVKKGIDAIVKFRDAIPEAFKVQTDPFINGMLLKGLVNQKKEAGLIEQADYILSMLPEADKKGF
ncbi:MAG TPA: M1 family aminopeptidase [Chitinophagaceae bacterium]|jgi:aminopeptidase N|nr:MAG: Aminopeptidase N [Bacteroidetes bacterium ADurb.BinA245]HNA92215.1 M1 family aminopeptidase [Chitinophagaceae bacterium]HND95066.1 M1 family aminopeptidase [Chitinophagaceae bacterium]HNF38940.1 M1 family aminopeptidase [Chitinophagaceae bacterium]HNF47220.1 M1 family aminopeptidase [Chitinophagaceae bacterium]